MQVLANHADKQVCDCASQRGAPAELTGTRAMRKKRCEASKQTRNGGADAVLACRLSRCARVAQVKLGDVEAFALATFQ